LFCVSNIVAGRVYQKLIKRGHGLRENALAESINDVLIALAEQMQFKLALRKKT